MKKSGMVKKTSRPYREFVQARSARLIAEVTKISEKLTSLPCMIKHRTSSVNTGAGQRTPIYGEKKKEDIYMFVITRVFQREMPEFRYRLHNFFFVHSQIYKYCLFFLN